MHLKLFDKSKITVFSDWGKKIAAWSIQQKIIAGVACGCVIVGAVAGGVSLYGVSQKKPAIAQIEDSETEKLVVKEPTSEKITVNLPTYSALAISSDSMEKDITVYFTDTEENKVAGKKFSVILAKQEEAAKVGEQIAKIKEYNTKLAEAQQTMSAQESDAENKTTEEKTDMSASKKAATEQKEQSKHKNQNTESTSKEVYLAGLTREEFATLSPVEQLTLEKEEAIRVYKEQVEALDGRALVDEDEDGMVYADKLEPGEYTLCYVPTEYYDPAEYAVKATVKDKVEYKKVTNIEKKVQKYDASQDTKPAEAAPQEAVKQNTVEYVDAKVIPAEYTAISGIELQATTSGEITKTEADTRETAHVQNGIMLCTETGGGLASLTAPTNAVFYSHVANSVNVQVKAMNMREIRVVTDGNCSASNQENGTFTITVNNHGDNYTGTVSFVGIATSGKEVKIDCTYTVYGGNNPIKTSDGKTLYVDQGNQKVVATYGNYTNGQAIYVETKPVEYRGWQTLDNTRYYFDKNGNKVTGKQVINNQEYNFGSDGALLTSGYGIDVSKWNKDINWAEAKSAISFAIIRAGFRGIDSRALNEDPYAKANIQGATANGIKIGLYYYSTAQNAAQAVEEASHAISIAEKYGKGKISLPIYIDMEDQKTQGGLSTAQRDEIVMAFCNTVKNSGYHAGVYANKNWFTNYLSPASYPGWVSIWYARYNDVPGYAGRFDIWQYTSDGTCPGVNGRVDMNISYF